MKLDDLIRRTDELVTKGDEVLSTERKQSFRSATWDFVDSARFSDFRSACLSFLLLVFGDKHPYYSEFNHLCGQARSSDVQKGLGILRAVRGELSGGWLFTVKWLVTSEIFGDFLEMAVYYLLTENYKDPAAVVGGSVLEEHLRQLCIKNGIDITYLDKGRKTQPKKADALNVDVSNAGVYNKLDQKNVTAWLDLRNKAAHGKYTEYTQDQVGLMLTGIRDFITRNPA